MEALDIVLVVIGLLFVIMSYALTEKAEATQQERAEKRQAKDVWTDKDEKLVMDHMKECMQEEKDTFVEQAREEMAEISNEKIMAVSEYSEQILEKIEQNHQQVVFLYDMLEKKQDELKELLKAKPEVSQVAEHEKPVEPVKTKSNNRKETGRKSSKKMDVSKINHEIASPSMANSQNSRILELCKKGKSVMDISKQLGIGQGEVKLVIDLYANQIQHE